MLEKTSNASRKAIESGLAGKEKADHCEYCKRGLDNLCSVIPNDSPEGKLAGGPYWGGYATAIQQPEKWAFHIPDSLPDEVVPNLMCAGLTTYAPIARYCKPAQEVAVLGVGGLGHMAVQFASKWGCRVTAFTKDLENEELIRKLGASRVMVTTEENVIKENTKYDVIINTIPYTDSKMMASCLDMLKPASTFVQIGISPLTGVSSIISLASKQSVLAGTNVGSRKECKEMLDFAVKHKIYPVLNMFKFEEFPKAYRHLKSGKAVFRCLVNCVEFAKRHGLFK